MSSDPCWVFIVGCLSPLCTNAWGRFLASLAYLSHVQRLSLTLHMPPMMVMTSLVTCRSSIHFPVPTRICLWKRAILALGLTPIYYTLTTPQVHTRPLYANNSRIYTCLLFFHRVLRVGMCGFSPRINICPSNTCSPQVITSSLHLRRMLLVGAHSPSPPAHTYLLNTYSLWVTTCPLHPHSHWIIIRSLCPRSHRTVIRPLWGGCTLPLSCLCRILRIRVCSFSPRVTTSPLSTYNPRVYTRLLHPHSHQIIIHLLCPHSHWAIVRPP